MNAIAKANELFTKHYPERAFVVQLGAYLKDGFVINYPDQFVMFRPVERNGSRAHIIDPAFKFLKPDTWYVDLAVGDLKKLIAIMPKHMKWICFARKFRKQLKFWSTNNLIRKTLCTQRRTS